MPDRHAILGPSGAYRWLVCTPSARFEEQIPEDETEYAEEGSLAHDLAALILSGRSGLFNGSHEHFNEFLSEIKRNVIAYYVGLKLSPDEALDGFQTMYEHADNWASLIIGYGGEILIEHEYDMSAYVPLGFGTADATNMVEDTLYVSDYKYGAGVRVMATGNKQTMLYGVGALTKAVERGHKPKNVVLTICQPRAGGTSIWKISVADLLTWAELEVKPKALLAIAGEGEFIPGSHCQFCKARTRCAAFFDRFAEVQKIRDKRVMTDKDRATVLTYGPLLTSWVNKIEEETARAIQARQPLKGFKLVAGRGMRKFRSEDNVVDILLGAGFESDQIFTPSFRALTDLEKSLGPKLFNELLAGEIMTVQGKPKVVPESDDREAIGASAADDYDDDLL